MHDFDALLAVAVELGEAAGALLLDAIPRRRAGLGIKTSATDMVSDADRASEQLILEGLERARPDDAVLAEEGGQRDGTSGVRWVVDPLDGTTNYLYGHPHFSISIAAEVDGEVVVGVVVDPSLPETFTAVRGHGARLNGEPAHASDHDELATALVATGFSYAPERRGRQGEVLSRILPAVRDVRRAGVASLDLCWVACGRLDCYYEVGLQPWDLAAGVLIAREAGARVQAVDGTEPSAASVVASSAALGAPFQRLLGDAGATALLERTD